MSLIKRKVLSFLDTVAIKNDAVAFTIGRVDTMRNCFTGDDLSIVINAVSRRTTASIAPYLNAH